MSKNIILTFAIVALLVFSANSQSLSHSVIGSAGGEGSNGNVSMTFTAGEAVTETFESGDYTLTQGFQQPYFMDPDDDPNPIVNQPEDDLNIDFYPNPVSDQLTVEVTSETNASYELSFYNMTGQKVSVPYNKSATNNGRVIFEVNMELLPEGVYMLRMIDNSSRESFTAKVTKIQ